MINGKLLTRKQIDVNRWDTFIKHSPQQSIYFTSWYLDSICSEWNAIIIEKNDEWIGVMPLNISTKMNISYSIQPIFTQYLGVLYANFTCSKHKELGLKKKIITEIIQVLPSNIKLIDYKFSPQFKYFLPFHWLGFDINPRISYQLALNKKNDEIYLNYSSRIKTDIKKAKKNNLTYFESEQVDELLKLSYLNGILTLDNCNTFMTLWKEIIARKKGYCSYVRGANGEIYAGGAFIKDRNNIIFILLSTKQKFKNLGPTSFLIHESIKKANQNKQFKYFDFEGSMIESVEYFFKGFNPKPITYYNIKKNKLGFIYPIYKKISNSLRGK